MMGYAAFGRLDLVHLDGLALELLVVLEEPPQHRQPVRRHLGRFAVAVELGSSRRDGDDLVVLLARVDHRHQADRAGVDERERDDRLLAQHQHVERVVVLGERLRDEAVVGRVVDGGVEDAVELEQAGLLVELVLDAGAERDLDDRVELLRGCPRRG